MELLALILFRARILQWYWSSAINLVENNKNLHEINRILFCLYVELWSEVSITDVGN